MYNIKYTVSVTPKPDTPYNPLHDEINNAECVVLSLKVGNMGWFNVKGFNMYYGEDWETIHTSIISGIESDPDDKVITVYTMNTVYKFTRLED